MSQNKYTQEASVSLQRVQFRLRRFGHEFHQLGDDWAAQQMYRAATLLEPVVDDLTKEVIAQQRRHLRCIPSPEK